MSPMLNRRGGDPETTTSLTFRARTLSSVEMVIGIPSVGECFPGPITDFSISIAFASTSLLTAC